MNPYIFKVLEQGKCCGKLIDSQEENIKIANVLGNNQGKNHAGILQRRRKYPEIFFTCFNYLHLILLKLCVISCISHLMAYFTLLFCFRGLFFFHNRLYDLSSNNINPYFFMSNHYFRANTSQPIFSIFH